MARKKPAKKAKAKSAKRKTGPTLRQAQGRPERSRGTKKAARRAAKAPKKAAGKSAKKASKPAPRKAAKKAAAPTRKASPARKRGLVAAVGTAVVSVVAAGVSAALSGRKKPNLDRPRKTVADVHGIPSSLDMGRSASSARTGRAELKERLAKNTSASPALTAGDIDADWESAETVGDEAPGGDNPTPDQDVVDEIGRALGVEYEDDEELQGGAEIADRDRNRWELDPSSKEDEDEET